MDVNNPVIQLCIQGTQAEFSRDLPLAHALYQQAWDSATDDYEACIAAHYLARFQETPTDAFHWNQEALVRANTADTAGDDRVREFYPSLYLNMGQSYEKLGQQAAARQYYDLAASLGFPHQAE
jgi:hypothetical protein